MIRTRFAPSPTGPLHLGHAYSAITAHDFARRQGGMFLLRIEDLDQSRARPEWEAQIFDDLAWLGLTWDGPVLRQATRSAAYEAALTALLGRGLIYGCKCSRRDIAQAASAPQEGAPPNWGPDGLVYPGTCRPNIAGHPLAGPARRLDMAAALAGCSEIAFQELSDDLTTPIDHINNVDHFIDNIGDVVLSRSDGAAAYHLAVVVDDAAQDITHVVRGADLLSATPIHALLQHLLGYAKPIYHHHALIRDSNGKRLAKRDDAKAIAATANVVLAYVQTGDIETDDISAAGLLGLSQTLFQRTSIEPANPVGVNLETDELAFFPFIYWPVTANQPLPSREAFGKLNRYLRTGGMILFDTRDADQARFGSGSPEGQKLQAIARGLDIPAIEPIPADHVLTRTFYLLQDFPGRYASRDIWVEAAPVGAEQAEGMPFRNLNDGVTPVVIGGNDWARAWAVDGNGNRMFPVGRGTAGEKQREYALRFGVNLVMHVLTGNYKSDQVHVPALLDRLGQ